MAISTISATGLAGSVSQIGKNIIINGSHEVAQRGAAITGMGAASAYTPVDMWHIISSGTAGRVTGSQVAGPLAATGHAKAVKIDVTTVDSSVASGDIMSLTVGSCNSKIGNCIFLDEKSQSRHALCFYLSRR